MIDDVKYDLAAVLAELFYGTASVDETLDRLLAPDFAQRINGEVYFRAAYRDHVAEMRQMVVGAGEVVVLQEVRQPGAVAGRYLFLTDTAHGRLEYESSVFARIDGEGKLRHLAEVNRPVAPEDSSELLIA